MGGSRYIRLRILLIFLILLLMSTISSKDLETFKDLETRTCSLAFCQEILHVDRTFEYFTDKFMKNKLTPKNGSGSDYNFLIWEYLDQDSVDFASREAYKILSLKNCKPECLLHGLKVLIFTDIFFILIINFMLVFMVMKTLSMDTELCAHMSILKMHDLMEYEELLSRENKHLLTKVSTFAETLTKLLNIKHDIENIIACLSSNDESETCSWLYKYRPSEKLAPEVFSVYPALFNTNLERLSSFSNILAHKVPQNVYFSELAEAGFRYTGPNLETKCDGCGKSANISNILTSPRDEKYHEQGCRFVLVAGDSEQQGTLFVSASSASDNKHLLAAEAPHGLQFQKDELREKADTEDEGFLNMDDIEDDSASVTPVETPRNFYPYSYPETVPEACFENKVRKSSFSPTGFNESPNLAEVLSDKLSSLASATHGRFTDFPIEERNNLAGARQQKEQLSKPPQIQVTKAASPAGPQGKEASTLLEHQRPNQTSRPSDHLAVPSTARQSEDTEATSGRRGSDSSEGSESSGYFSDHQDEVAAASAVSASTAAASAVSAFTAAASATVLPASSKSATYAPKIQFESFDLEEFDPELESSNHDVQISRDTCKKNPGHFANFPMWQFQMDYIPSSCRHQDVLRFFSLIATLTVRVVVSAVSKHRPDFAQPGPKFRFGTGFVFWRPDEEQELNGDMENPRKFDSFRKHLHFGKKKGYVYVEINRHLVFDDTEAESATVEFFYDNPNRKGIVLAKGVSVMHSTVLGDCKSILRCRTSDLSLIDMVKESRNEVESLAKNFPRKIKEALMRRVFVISHPHGGEKVFSYGEYVLVKYELKTEKNAGQTKTRMVKINNHTQISQNADEIRKVLLYTVDTCAGSTGAAVVFFKMTGTGPTDNIVLDLWMHHGVDKKHSLNASVMRVLTSDDIANHGRPDAHRPSVQDELNAESDSAANQPVSYPVFTVLSPPSHAAYANYKKRLASFPEPFNHVHMKADLADAGFFYAGYGDCVRCFHCGLGLRSWKPGDSIHEEHHKNRPDCQFLQLKLRANGITSLGFQTHPQQPAVGQSSAESQEATGVSSGAHQSQQKDVMKPQRTAAGEVMSVSKFLERNILSPPNVHQQEVIVGMALQSPVQNGAVTHVSRNQAITVLEREQQYLKQLMTCKVCFMNPVKDLFMPCGELVACADCSKLLTDCPSCGKKIMATVTTYFS